jgi:predicted DNA-binding transcriptional regulator AlpA
VSQLSTGSTREERGAGTAVAGSLDPVLTIIEVAKLLSLGEHTFRTMLREGRGPTVTKLSHRRIGIRGSHLQQWLNGCATIEGSPAR